MANMKYFYALIAFCAVFFLAGLGLSKLPVSYMTELPSVIAIILLAVPVCIGCIMFGKTRAMVCIILLGLFSLTIETIGIHTGFPYSFFQYELELGQKLFGTTPWTVFFGWFPLVIGSYVFSRLIMKNKSNVLTYLSFILILVLTDLVLDPGSVARGFWSYEIDGLWYGVPLVNFLGWVFSGSIAYGIIHAIGTLIPKQVSVLAIVFSTGSLLLSIALWSAVNLGYYQWVPACIGIILFTILISSLREYLKRLKEQENKE
jgi:putative membrane protein